MKIESSTKTTGASLVMDARSASASKTAPAKGDEVKLSALSSQMLTTDTEQSFDRVRVSEIKQAIAEGRFVINAGAIADRLIASAKELVDSQRQA